MIILGPKRNEEKPKQDADDAKGFEQKAVDEREVNAQNPEPTGDDGARVNHD